MVELGCHVAMICSRIEPTFAVYNNPVPCGAQIKSGGAPITLLLQAHPE